MLLHELGDPIAYFNVNPDDSETELPDGPPERGPSVQADISGRHFHDDAIVLSVLRKVQEVVGGVIRDDDDASVCV